MIVLQSKDFSKYSIGKTITWTETSQWSGSQMTREGKITSSSKAQSGCYHLGIESLSTKQYLTSFFFFF